MSTAPLRRRLAVRPLPRRADDRGYALVTVIGSMFALTLVAMAALGAAVGGLPQSRAAQADAAALAAAQALGMTRLAGELRTAALA